MSRMWDGYRMSAYVISIRNILLRGMVATILSTVFGMLSYGALMNVLINVRMPQNPVVGLAIGVTLMGWPPIAFAPGRGQVPGCR